jgi:hypothetical protein
LELTGHKPSDFLKVPEAGNQGATGSALPFDLTAILSTKQLRPEHAAALLSLVAGNTPTVPVPEKEVETVTVR